MIDMNQKLETNLENKESDLNQINSEVAGSDANFNDDLDNMQASNNAEDSNVVNCLALTVKKDYNLSIVKNVMLKTLKNAWRVALSIFTLNFLKFFL